jgi:hypothetical protein
MGKLETDEFSIKADPLYGTVEFEPVGRESYKTSGFLCDRETRLDESVISNRRGKEEESHEPLLVKLTSFLKNPPPARHVSASVLCSSSCCAVLPRSASVAVAVIVHIRSHRSCQFPFVRGTATRS